MQIKKLPTKYIVLFVLGFVGVLAGSVFLYLKFTHKLTPGPLSDAHPQNISLGGVSSHAELETKCTHCHAPIHCITDTKCQDCHLEIAKDRMDSSTLHGRLPGVSKCQNCHTEHNGDDATLTEMAFLNVDHYILAGFSLDKHNIGYEEEQLDCSSCHSDEGNFKETADCVSCHAKEDHDYIASHIEEYGYACADCHDGKDRMMTGIHHEDWYELIGEHEDLACADCHTEQQYVGLDASCISCHEDPALHAGVFGTDCTLCHTAVAWAPAVLREHDFLMSHSDDGEELTCETCHQGTYTEYPCGACHEDADMELAHADVETPDLHDCISCHPTGKGSLLITENSSNEDTVDNISGTKN